MTTSCYRQHRTRPCKNRKSGAPAVPKRERKNEAKRAGDPPTVSQASGQPAKTEQNTSAAAVAPVTTAPLVIDKIIVTVEAAAEKGFDISLGAIGGTIGFIFASSQEAGSPKELIFEHEQKEKQEEAAPAAAAGGAGKGAIPGHPFRGPNAAQDAFKHLEQFHGISPTVASERLHNMKAAYGLGAADNVVIGRTGDVYNSQTGERLGSLTDKHW